MQRHVTPPVPPIHVTSQRIIDPNSMMKDTVPRIPHTAIGASTIRRVTHSAPKAMLFSILRKLPFHYIVVSCISGLV